jgi:transposase
VGSVVANAAPHAETPKGSKCLNSWRESHERDYHSCVGLDIHKDSVALAVAVAEAGRTAPRFVGTTPSNLAFLCKALTRCAKRGSTLVAYEAGPCGYGWARHLSAQGWHCEVISPAHITRKAVEKRLKNDRLDAVLLARESRAGNLVKVVMPDERDEAIRDLLGAREDVTGARLRARLQLKAMLLRHGRAYHGKSSWTLAHAKKAAILSPQPQFLPRILPAPHHRQTGQNRSNCPTPHAPRFVRL